jgi:hypothetical protein
MKNFPEKSQLTGIFKSRDTQKGALENNGDFVTESTILSVDRRIWIRKSPRKAARMA